nr:Chain C, kDa immediate-early protein 1 [Human herpesvirus 5 strain Towne]
ELRRKMMYM